MGLREGKRLARNPTANKQQKEDLNSELSDVTAHVPDLNAMWPVLVVMERSGAWPCLESGDMSHHHPQGWLESERSPAMGWNVPPDAEAPLPALLSLFHAEEREERARRRQGRQPSECSLDRRPDCWVTSAHTSGLWNAEAPAERPTFLPLLVAGSSSKITPAARSRSPALPGQPRRGRGQWVFGAHR